MSRLKKIGKTDLERMCTKENMSCKEIAKYYKVGLSTIRRRFEKYNIERLSRTEIITKEALQNLYVEKGKTLHEIAMIFGVSIPTISCRMEKYGIKRRTFAEAQRKLKLSKEELYRLYWDKEMSGTQIGKLFKVHSETVRALMKKYGIPRRNLSESTKGKERKSKTKKLVTKEELSDMYTNRKLSTSQIAKLINVSQTSVVQLLRKNGIPRRNYSEFRDKISKARVQALHSRPTKPEERFMEIIKKYNLPYRYTGDGDVIIGGKNPDFFNTNGNKVVVEIFGEVFHSPLFTFIKNIPYRQTYNGTIKHYKKYGLKCIIFWSRDVLREDSEKFIIQTLKSEGGM